MDKKIVSQTGTQSASKVLNLLKLVGASHPQGVRLTDLIAQSGFDRSTSHRLLVCLMEAGFVERTAARKLYRLDMEAMQLGLVSAGLTPLVDRFRPVMQRVARTTGDTVFLMMRSGDHALCLHREEGSYPIKAFVVEPGTRRLLGTSSVGIAVLSSLPDSELLATHARHVAEYTAVGMPLQRLQQMVRAAREIGFVEMDDFRTKETSGVGCAVRLSSNGHGGISVAAISSRMPAQRRREVGAQLQDEMQAFVWRGTTSQRPGLGVPHFPIA